MASKKSSSKSSMLPRIERAAEIVGNRLAVVLLDMQAHLRERLQKDVAQVVGLLDRQIDVKSGLPISMSQSCGGTYPGSPNHRMVRAETRATAGCTIVE